MKKALFNIVLVEDDFAFGSSLVELLEAYNFKVKWFRNSIDAFAWITIVKGIDVIITDVMMPDMDGNELGKELGKINQIKNIPIIYITALPNDALQLKDINFLNVIHKPFSVDKLINIITPLISPRSQQSDLDIKNVFERIMDSFYANEDVLKIILTRMQMEEKEFFKWVTNNYGLDFNSYLEKTKVKKALLSIKMKNRNFEKIAINCGFIDESHFREVFKKHMGLGPEFF